MTPIRSGLIKRVKKELKEVKKKIRISYFFVLVALFVLLLTLLFIDSNLKDQLSQKQIRLPSFPLPTPALYPQIKNVLGIDFQDVSKKDEVLDLSAEAVLVMDDDSKVVLFAKNPNLRFSMASTTKIMTALTALDHYQLDEILTVQEDNIEGVAVGFKKGERVSFENLLYAMLLPSANDAAKTLAQNYPGGESKFVKKMNENALRFNLNNTHFSDATGLNDEGNYTTSVDLARLASIALKNKTFAKIVSTKYKVVTDETFTNFYPLENLNKLLGVDGVNGVKTGFTNEAEGVLVTSKLENGHIFIIVVMRSKDRFLDTKKLLGLISGNVSYLNLSKN